MSELENFNQTYNLKKIDKETINIKVFNNDILISIVGEFNKNLNELEKFNIEILANSSLNLSGDPTCFDLIDSIMVSARTPLKYLVTDLGLLEYINSK